VCRARLNNRSTIYGELSKQEYSGCSLRQVFEQPGCFYGVDFYTGVIEQLVGATGSRPIGNSCIPATRFILDQSGKFQLLCPLWGKKYVRFAGGKAVSIQNLSLVLSCIEKVSCIAKLFCMVERATEGHGKRPGVRHSVQRQPPARPFRCPQEARFDRL